jgi:hypothetical protein
MLQVVPATAPQAAADAPSAPIENAFEKPVAASAPAPPVVPPAAASSDPVVAASPAAVTTGAAPIAPSLVTTMHSPPAAPAPPAVPPAVSAECRIISVLTSYPHAVNASGAAAVVQFGAMFAGAWYFYKPTAKVTSCTRLVCVLLRHMPISLLLFPRPAGERREVLIKLLVPALPNFMHPDQVRVENMTPCVSFLPTAFLPPRSHPPLQNVAVIQRLLSASLAYHDVSTELLCVTAPPAELSINRYSAGSAALGRLAISAEVDAAVNRELATSAMLEVRGGSSGFDAALCRCGFFAIYASPYALFAALQATHAAEQGNYAHARATLEAAIQALTRSVSAEHSTTRGLVGDMRTALSRVRDRTAMESGGRAYMMSTVTSNQQQRFTGSDVHSASAAAYASPSQVRMATKGSTYSKRP